MTNVDGVCTCAQCIHKKAREMWVDSVLTGVVRRFRLVKMRRKTLHHVKAS